MACKKEVIKIIGKIISTKELNVNNYGEYVDIGVDVVGENSTDDDWRIFYVGTEEDGKNINGRIYLISADYVAYDKIPEETATSIGFTPYKNKSKGKVFPIVLEWEKGKIPQYTGWNMQTEIFMATRYDIKENIERNSSYSGLRCVAALLNTEAWKNLLNKTSLAQNNQVYVAGAATIELWAKSWNKKYGEGKVDDGITLDCTKTYQYGYCVNTSKSADKAYVYQDLSTCLEGSDDTLYFPHKENYEGASAYYIASTSSDMMYVRENKIGNTGAIVVNKAIRPVISLPANIELTKTIDGNKTIYKLK